jgi:putative spermidine/putrescine transport system ATP-binding protein
MSSRAMTDEPVSACGTQSEAPPALRVEGLSKRFGHDVWALREVSLAIEAREFVTLLGPSGSGKTTLLMIVAGFESATAGRVWLRGEEISGVPPQKRNLGVVFQSYALFQNMTVGGNVAYPLTARRVKREERRSRVERALEMVGLEGLEDRRPSQISGGQQQRVALARALVYEPSILLLDEPLGALDRALRERMQLELRALHRRVGSTFVCVTHDQDEALTMSDRIVVMSGGRIEQVGPPADVYDRPASEFVATFIGTANMLEGTVVEANEGDAVVRTPDDTARRVPCAAGLKAGDAAKVVVRPERLRIERAADRGGLSGTVADVTFAGRQWRYEVATPRGAMFAHASDPVDAPLGSTVELSWDPARAWVVPAQP